MAGKFQNEVDILNDIYSEMIDAIEHTPDTSDYEKSRIYFENVISHLHKWAMDINKIKKNIDSSITDLSTDNRPA